MEYTIKQLAELAGISTRTLRYYDQINLLKPHHINSSGYRIYRSDEVDKLQQILFFRALDISLQQIKAILSNPKTDSLTLLNEHKVALLLRRQHLDALIDQVEQTLAAQKGEYNMEDTEKFKAFKETIVKENDRQYGQESREKYGDKKIQEANETLLGMSETNFKKHQLLEETLLKLLKDHTTITIPSEVAETIFKNHKQWLKNAWGSYVSEAHLGLAQLYLADERFLAYYEEKAGVGSTLRLVEIINYYASKD